MTKEDIYKDQYHVLRLKKMQLEAELLAILERWSHSEGPLPKEFRLKKHNYKTLCEEIIWRIR